MSDQIVATIVGGFVKPVQPCPIQFRNAIPREVGTNGTWYQVDVVVDFEYDEFI